MTQYQKPDVPYSQEIADEILWAVATSSFGLRKLCSMHSHWPAYKTIFDWRNRIPGFGDAYMMAKRDQADTLVDEILDIADNTSNDTIIKTNKDGQEYEAQNSEWINRSRLRVDTRKWLAAKLYPHYYGDKIHTEHSGSVGLHEKSLQELDKNDGDK